MAKPKAKGKKDRKGKRKYERDEPVSLHPLTLEEALGALLKTPPEKDAEKSSGAAQDD